MHMQYAYCICPLGMAESNQISMLSKYYHRLTGKTHAFSFMAHQLYMIHKPMKVIHIFFFFFGLDRGRSFKKRPPKIEWILLQEEGKQSERTAVVYFWVPAVYLILLAPKFFIRVDSSQIDPCFFWPGELEMERWRCCWVSLLKNNAKDFFFSPPSPPTSGPQTVGNLRTLTMVRPPHRRCIMGTCYTIPYNTYCTTYCTVLAHLYMHTYSTYIYTYITFG